MRETFLSNTVRPIFSDGRRVQFARNDVLQSVISFDDGWEAVLESELKSGGDCGDSPAMSNLSKILQNDPGFKDSYRHGPKKVTPGEPLETDNVILKWYRLAPEDQAVPEQIERLGRNFLTTTKLEATGLGFAILHRCGSDFYFLIVCSWRGNNEAWETVYYKDGEAMSDFALWPRDGMHKPSFCVWELMAVWHETKSWERFLLSARNEDAAKTWQRDLYGGPA